MLSGSGHKTDQQDLSGIAVAGKNYFWNTCEPRGGLRVIYSLLDQLSEFANKRADHPFRHLRNVLAISVVYRTQKRKLEKLKAGGQEEFWGLWNLYLSKTRPLRLENSQKSIVFSFAAVWCRALALKYSAGDAGLTALKLVHNPSYEAQRPLWEALVSRKRLGFLDYFHLSENGTLPLYNQWQGIFDAFRAGGDIPWLEIVNVTRNMLTAIEAR